MLTELATLVDTVTLMPGNPGSPRITELARAAGPAPAVDMLVPPVRVPKTPGEEPPAFAEAKQLGVGELGLYNYGLLRDRDVRNFVDAFRRRVRLTSGDLGRSRQRRRRRLSMIAGASQPESHELMSVPGGTILSMRSSTSALEAARRPRRSGSRSAPSCGAR